MKNQKTVYTIFILIAIVMLIIGFQIGKKISQPARNFKMPSNNINGKQMNMNNLSGEVIEKTDEVITIKLKTGSSKFVVTSPTTEVFKTVNVGLSELKIGDSIVVDGQTTTDGSIIANSLRVVNNFPNQINK
jgi:hypothetical protein